MTIDDTTIRELIDFDDPIGVLSFYVGNTPQRAAERQPTAPIEIRNQLKELTGGLGKRDPDRAKAVERRLGRIGPALDLLLDPKAPGRGRALFVGVESGRSESLALQIPFRERVVLHDSAYVRPLVAAHDEGREAGVYVVSRSGARLLRWSVGEVEELATFGFEVSDEVLAADRSGPSPGNPSDPRHGYVNRERFEDRIDENRHRFLKEVGEDVVGHANEHGWDRVVLAGPPKAREMARELLPNANSVRVIMADQAWEDEPPHLIAEHAWPLLRSVHRERERELAEAARERALSGGPGALGMRNVTQALNAGRVAHLLYASDLAAEGYVAEDGTLHARVEGFAAQTDQSFSRESLFVERLIERAIGTSAQVTPVEPDATDLLSEHDGVAALLRW
jgi:peptide subunit release factor 1 (eRF1)